MEQEVNMPDDSLDTATEQALAVVESYDGLSRDERMDRRVLNDHADRFHQALETLVAATGSHLDASLPEPMKSQANAAKQALDEFAAGESYDTPQHARRACYVLRERTTSLLDALHNDA
jgi:hypothetical protein